MVEKKKELYSKRSSMLKDRSLGEPDWLSECRRDAMVNFEELGFPTQHDEDWKYTNLTAVSTKEHVIAEVPNQKLAIDDINSVGFEEVDAHQVIFLNGRLIPELSCLEESSLEVGNLLNGQDNHLVLEHFAKQTGTVGNSLAALNTAFFGDGIFIHVPDRVIEKKPIHLVFVTIAEQVDQFTHPRTLLIAGQDSQATVIESFVGMGEEPYWTNTVTEIVAAENAHIQHYKLQQEHVKAHHTGFLFVDQARNSNVTSHSLSFGGRLVRSDAHVRLGGEGCECTLNGLYAVMGDQHVDHHTTIEHAQPHCKSNQLYRGVLDGRSKGVFNGKIIVRQDAQQTDAVQSNKNLLLSRKAEINTKPQLEIDANDVRCTHGATIGQIDEEAVFYLRSRGIQSEEARSLLTYAFVADILENLQVDGWHEPLEEMLFDWVQQAQVE